MGKPMPSSFDVARQCEEFYENSPMMETLALMLLFDDLFEEEEEEEEDENVVF